MFLECLDVAIHYFEWGSGGSTYEASLKDNLKTITTVESDYEWITKLQQNISKGRVKYLFTDIDAAPNNWGEPGLNATHEAMKSYSEHIRNVSSNELDLILIDGRFRVSCCLKSFDMITNDCIIAFDDFLNRPQYHSVLDYYEIIKSGERMVLLQKKNVESPTKEIIEKWELEKN